MDLIMKEIDYRVKNNIALGEESIDENIDEKDEKSSNGSFAINNQNRLSARTYSREKNLNNNIFSPNSSSKLSFKTVLSDKKKSLNILPIRNLINLKKSQNNKNKNNNKEENKKKENEKKGKYIITKNNKENI